MPNTNILSLLGGQADNLLSHTCQTIDRQRIRTPTPHYEDEWFGDSNRNPQVLCSLQRLFSHGRLGDTGYLSIFPVDQGIEHSAGASFAKNPIYFDGEKIIETALEAGCNGVATTFGVLAQHSRKYAHKIPFVVKINHNQLLSYPSGYDQIMFGSVKEAWNLGATAIGATIYFGSEESDRQIQEVSQAFELAHELGMVTILWCYLRNSAFKKDIIDYHTATDLSSQACHIGVTLQADIIKQKLPTTNEGYRALNFGKTDDRVYNELTTDHPIDLTRYMVLNCYAGKIGLINSGGGSQGDSDLQEAVRTAVVNKRAGGIGLILGRKAFSKPQKEGIALLQAVQDVYLDNSIGLA
ncbi:MAG: class I fructose-bisphosphate aldolase [Cyclobacteriaceae bacterium]